jgi:outer membrane protein assembly factor BamD
MKKHVRPNAARGLLVLVAGMLLLAGCTRRQPVDTPLISDSQQPDKELFDRATNFLEHARYTEARLLLQTLINAYPDSEYLAQAKLSIADSWYREGGSSNLLQAEAEYRDFITFFPTMPEAGEAQMRVAMIHYREMEKPDRDPTHARRAEQEFQRVLLDYPDGPFVPLAEQRLREAQEVLAQGAFEIGRFYFLQGADRAAQPRLKELVDRYPNYSRADTALFLLASSLERSGAEKGSTEAVPYYARIVRDYPLSPHVPDATSRLNALGAPVPNPDPVAVARMTYQKAHWSPPGLWDKVSGIFRTTPDVSAAQGSLTAPTMTAQGPAQPGVLTRTSQASAESAPSRSSSPESTIVLKPVVPSGSGSATPAPR